jgi:rubrerythrin
MPNEKKDTAKMGMNRTGLGMSPIDAQKTIEGARNCVPSMEGDDQLINEIRQEYVDGDVNVGSVPPPPTVKGAAKAAMKMMTGKQPNVLLDKIGERLAFERTGTRLYEALIFKAQHSTLNGEGPSLDRLQEIHDEEMKHMGILWNAMQQLGADPTAETPCADTSGVMSIGLLQVLTDPRTTVAQCLSAILTAELVDNDGWTMLIDLAGSLGHKDLVGPFQQALNEEEEHLAYIRKTLTSLTLSAANV